MAIRPRSRSRGSRDIASASAASPPGRDAGLARLAAHVDLYADVERRQAGGSRLVQALGDLFALDPVHPLEVLGDGACLVALDRADEVPRQRQTGELRDFFHAFLRLVLAKCALPAGVGLRDHRGRKGLAHRDERNVIGRPSGGCRRARDALPHGLQVGGDCAHNFLRLDVRCEVVGRKNQGSCPLFPRLDSLSFSTLSGKLTWTYPSC